MTQHDFAGKTVEQLDRIIAIHRSIFEITYERGWTVGRSRSLQNEIRESGEIVMLATFARSEKVAQ